MTGPEHRPLAHNGSPLSLTRLVAGANSPAYAQLKWSKQRHLHLEDMDPYCVVPGDPEAGRLPRSWENVAVLSAEWDDILTDYSQTSRREDEFIEQAVAFEANGVVTMGVGPSSESIFGSHDKRAAIGMRIGRGALRATMGLWLPEQRRLVVPRSVRVEDRTTVSEIATTHPGIRLV